MKHKNTYPDECSQCQPMTGKIMNRPLPHHKPLTDKNDYIARTKGEKQTMTTRYEFGEQYQLGNLKVELTNITLHGDSVFAKFKTTRTEDEFSIMFSDHDYDVTYEINITNNGKTGYIEAQPK